MGEELKVPTATLAEIQTELGRGESALEDTAASAPTAIDAGDLTAMLTSMMSKVIDRAASVSEGLAGISSQVAEAGAHFWEVDADVATTYGGREAPGAY